MDTKALLDSLDMGVVAVAPDWTIAEWSAGAARITGLPAEQALRRDFWIAFSGAKGTDLEQVLRAVLADGTARTCLMPAHASDGPGTVFETRVTRGPHNHLVMTLRRMHEELPPESRAAQLLGAFEIERRLYLQLFNSLPTPGLVLTADGQILEVNPEGAELLGVPDAPSVRGRSLTEWAAESQRAALATALRDAVDRRQEFQLTLELAGAPARDVRAGRIVQTLLDFARQRPRVRAAVDLAEIVERVLSLQRSALKKARARGAVAIPDDLPAVIGDPQELQQVMLNAVVNARQAIEASGRPGQVLITAKLVDGRMRVAVEDTGAGVPPEILDRVFEPFFTTKGDEGTGLGLAISFGLVRAMGGRMWIQNIEGGGARLEFELPIDTVRAADEAAAGLRPAERSLRVLVVEDEESVRRGMVLLAKRLGHEVTSVPGYDEAKRRLTEPAARYDAMIVDVHLDEAHSGFDLFEDLRVEGRGRERHIVFTTGDSISAQTRDHLLRSERPVLRKPFSLDELREMLERVAGA